jgi:hypothetical protein
VTKASIITKHIIKRAWFSGNKNHNPKPSKVPIVPTINSNQSKPTFKKYNSIRLITIVRTIEKKI